LIVNFINTKLTFNIMEVGSMLDYSNDEEKLYKENYHKFNDADKATDFVLLKSLNLMFESNTHYTSKIPFQNYPLEEALEDFETVMSRIGLRFLDNEGGIAKYIGDIDKEGRVGLKARIVENNPSFLSMRLASNVPEEKVMKLKNYIEEQYKKELGNAYVQLQQVSSVDTPFNATQIDDLIRNALDDKLGSLNAKMDIALSELLGNRLVTNFYIDKGGFEKDTGFYVVKKGETFQGVIEIEPVKEPFELVGLYSTMKIKKLIGEYKGHDPKDLEGIKIKPRKKETIEFKLKSPKDQRSVVLGLLGFLDINGEECSAEPRTEPITVKPGKPTGQKLLHYGKKYGLKAIPIVRKLVK